jgi:hypothetical protein
MTFATLDLLAGIIATRATAFGCLERLAIDNGGTRRFAPPLHQAIRRDQRRVDDDKQTAVTPAIEIVLISVEGRDIDSEICRRINDGGH